MGLFVHNEQALFLYSNCCSLGLLNQELKEKFTTYTMVRYSSQQNKPIIIPELLCNLRKKSILEIFSTALCDI